jgi:DNA gyrase subunit B
MTGLEPVRVRPRLYVGSTDAAGLRALTTEALGWALDEHLAGFSTRLSVRLTDGAIELADDGRGLAADAIERTLTTLNPAEVDARARGAGIAVVNALSERLEVVTDHDGERWAAAFSRGLMLAPPRRLGDATSTGTTIRFVPDTKIFSPAQPEPEAIEQRITELAWLTPRLAWSFQGRGLQRADGLAGLVTSLAPIFPGTLFTCEGAAGRIQYSVAAGLTTAPRGKKVGFVNFFAVSAGSHVRGVVTGVRQAFPALVDETEKRLVVAVHVGVPFPRFTGVAGNEEVERAVAAAVSTTLQDKGDLTISWLEAMR